MIYEPITEFGKKIAGLLKYDDGVRLDIHDYLEEVEPVLQGALEKAEKWDKLETQLPSEELLKKMAEYRTNEQKLEAIKKHLESIPESFIIQAYTVLNRDTPDHHLWNFEIWYTDVKKILDGSYFTTNHDKETNE